MPFQSSKPECIKTLFSGNKFMIPDYQRRYSWGYEQRTALWDDIEENIQLKHFVGTLIFKKSETYSSPFTDQYEVIDGQQRMTTIFFLLHSLIENLNDPKTKQRFHRLYVVDDDGELKVLPMGDDKGFVKKLIEDFNNIDKNGLQSRSQRKLYDAKREFLDRTKDFSDDKRNQWINFITNKLELLLFNVENESQAVRMFTVINDRGLPLSYFDKTKSILMLYSTQYLDNELNQKIHESFKNVFLAIDQVILLRKKLDIFARTSIHDFETTLYTHFYYTARNLFTNWDYQLGGERIFGQLKEVCEKHKEEKTKLSKFLSDYINSLESFTRSYSQLFEKIDEGSPQYEKYFQYMEFAATLYPVIVILFQKGMLEDCFDLLETIEIRIYKLRGTNPRSKIYRMASDMNAEDIDLEEVRGKLVDFAYLMNDRAFESYMDYPIDSKRGFLRYAFYMMNNEEFNQNISLSEYRNMQVEHIFSRTPNFQVESFGYDSHIDYENELNRMGNLTLLEAELNNSDLVKNLAPKEKTEGYNNSGFRMTQSLISELPKFDKTYVESRHQKLKQKIMSLFPINEKSLEDVN